MKILIADDHPLFRLGLSMALSDEGFDVVAEASNGREAVERSDGVDVVVLDVKMPELDGIEACRVIAARERAPLVVMLSTFEEPAIVQAARDAGASAYLSKDTAPRELAQMLRSILAQPDASWMPAVELPSLTPREADVLRLLARGLANKAIARSLEISPETVKEYMKELFRKLGVRDRLNAVRRAGELGLL